MSRDTRPPADRHAEIEAALDRRVIVALVSARRMAQERHIVATGHMLTRDDVRRMAERLAEPITDGQAAEVIEALNTCGLYLTDELVLDKIWDVIG